MYYQAVSTIQEIEAAIAQLPDEDYRQLMRRLEERRNAAWDRQMEEDAANGNLDKLWAQAEKEIEEGETMPLDEFLRHQELP